MADPIRLPVDADEGNVQLTVEEMRVVEAVSPTVTAERDEDGVMITVHDLNGTRTAHVNDGETGEAGNGIVSTALNQDYTLSITFTDGTTWTSPMPIRGATGNGIASTTLNRDYTLSVAFTDGTTWTSQRPIRGETGATPDMSIGTVQTLPAGSQATAQISGTAERPVLSLGIPKGDPGDATIDDTAGAGDTTKVWSADKTATEFSDVKSAFKHRESYDYVDITTLVDSKNNTYILYSNGEERSVDNCIATDFIDISKFTHSNIEMNFVLSSYPTLRIYQGAFYDENKNYIAGYNRSITSTSIENITVPANARYVRMSIPKDVVNTFYAKMETKVYHVVGNGVDTPAIFYKNITPGGYINRVTGEVNNSSNTVGYTDYIHMEHCSIVSIRTTAGQNSYQMAFYDSEKQYVSGILFNATADMTDLTVPINATYARFTVISGNFNDFEYALKDVNLNNVFDILYKQMQKQDESRLQGKKISFLGDSITTYNGYIPSGYATFYPANTVTNVNLTWWKKLIDNTGMVLLKNASWSGSNICGNTLDTTGAVGCSDARVNALADGNTTPDVIVVFIGINDFGHASYNCGNYDGSTEVSENTTISTITEAYGVLFKKLQSTYKNAKIFACTLMAEQGNSSTGMANSYPNGFPNINRRDNVTLPTLNEFIKKICTAFGVTIIPFAETINFYNALDYTGDGLHPNALQMEKMYALARNVIEGCF